jgi:hypothetical protein
MTELFQFGAALLGFLTAVAVAIPTLIQYRTSRESATSPEERRAGRAFAWITRPRSILIGVAILGGISILLLIQLNGSDKHVDITAARLLRQLADEDAYECETVEAQVEGALASLQCNLDEPMRTVTMSLMASTAEVKDIERARLASLESASGDCTIQSLGWQEWRRGKLICDYTDPAGARIEWSRYDSDTWLAAEAQSGAAPDRVYDWWNYDDSGAPANNRLAYPDRYERYIAETAGMDPDKCERADGYKESLGAVTCDRPGFKPLFFGYYDDSKSLHEALGLEPGRGWCASHYRYDADGRSWVLLDREPGRRVYSIHGDVAGTRDCYEDRQNREVVVEWTNQDKELFGFAKWTDSDDLDGLFRWWEKKGRYLTD